MQLDVAVPELNKRHLRGTFFVIVSKLTRLDEWRQAQADGHEIGNHTVAHEHPAALTKEEEESQVEDAKNFLDSNFHANIITFAYPYMEMTSGILFWVKKYNFAARGWPQDPNLLYVRADIRNGEQRFTWEVPALFPSGVVLKMRLAGQLLHVYQRGRELRADRQHIYSVAFDARELVMRGAL